MDARVLRFENRQALIGGVAARLLAYMIDCQARRGAAYLGLTSGRLVNAVYDRLAAEAPASALAADQVHLWWCSDLFTTTDNPARHSLQALSHLAAGLALDPAKIHAMPSTSVAADPEAAAQLYEQELGATQLDLCLTELGPGGVVPGLAQTPPPTPARVVPQLDLTPPALAWSREGLETVREVWVLASGSDSATDLAAATAGEPDQPGTQLAHHPFVLWLADESAAHRLPFHQCAL